MLGKIKQCEYYFLVFIDLHVFEFCYLFFILSHLSCIIVNLNNQPRVLHEF